MLLSLTPWWHLLSRIFLPRTRGQGFWWRTLAIIQEAQVSAVSAAASNLQLLRRDALLKNFGFQPQVLSTVRTAPLEGSHVLGPEPKVLQNRVRAIRQADRMAGSSVMFTQKHRESKSSMKVTSSRKTVFRTPVFDQPGSPTATREEWHRSRPFQLAPAGEPATDPTSTATRSLTRFLRLPQPGNVDGSQVGARLADFAPHWWSLLGNCRATAIVEDGVGIAFQQRPQLTHQCISFRTRNSGQDLQQAVDVLLMKGAIEQVTNVASLGYFNRLFMVPKKTGDLRPVIDLSTLNRHMLVPHLKMEMQWSVRSAIRSQEWTVSLVIHDAYLHVPMHQAVFKYLSFRGQQESVHLSSIWAGDFCMRVHKAATACRNAVKAARYEATRLLRRLADQSRYSGTGQTARPDNHQGAPVSRLDHQLREVRPHSKSRLPVHRDAVQHSTIHSGAPTEDASRGQVRSSAKRVRLRLRPVQWWAATAWCQRTGSWSDRITVPQWVLSEVAWWASPAVLQGLPLATKETEVTLFTDGYSSGWGAQLGSRSTRGQWSSSQRSWHINALGMQAVINAVRDFLPHLRSWVVCLMCDNAVTVAYIKNEGGTRSHTLMQMTIRLLKWSDIGSRPSARSAQHPGGFPVQNRPDTDHGVDDGHGASKTRVCRVGRAAGRLVCDIRQQMTHQICIAVYGPQGRVDRCHGTTGGATCTHSSYSRWSLKFCRRSLSLQVSGWFWSLNCNRQRRGFQSWWICPKKIRSCCMSKFKHDLLTQDVLIGEGVTKTCHFRPSNLHAGKLLWAFLRAKGHSRKAANMMSTCLWESSLHVYESHWSRFVAFCRWKRWHVFRVRSHHISTYMMYLFRDGLLPSTITSHRISVASVLRHWVHEPVAYPYIKLLVRAFRLESPVQCRIMPKWDLHLVLLSLLRPVMKTGNPRKTSFP